MKRFNEQDIEKMLSKTESTSPDFDKNVSFPQKTVLLPRRRRYGALLAAACLIIVSVAGTAVMLLSNRSGDVVIPDNSATSEFVSGVSLHPNPESQGFTNESFDFPEYSEGVMSTAGESSEFIEESTNSNIENPRFSYPQDNSFYVGQGLKQDMTVEEFLAENQHSHLGGRINLPVYKRAILDIEQRKSTIEAFSASLGLNFEFDETMYNITGDCRGLSQDKHYSINASEYGDWYFVSYTVDYLKVNASANENEAFTEAVRSFVEENRLLFEEGEFAYSAQIKDGRVYVTLKNKNRIDLISNKMSAYVFAFKRNSNNSYSLASIEYKNCGEKLGEYETKLYDTALNEMFANSFFSEHGFTFGNEDTFKLVGYDVRYLSKNKEALVCPYYSFIVEVNPGSEDSYFRTLFVPAVIHQEPIPEEFPMQTSFDETSAE